MSLRKATGKGAKALLRCTTVPADELPLGVQAPVQESAGDERRPDGTFARGARTAQSAGGKATKGKSRLAARLGLSSLPDDSAVKPYLASAATFRRVECAALAATVGAGTCGPAPSSIVGSAALALGWSRYFSDQAALTGDPELATKAVRLADSSRQMLLTAHELCAREAEARSRRPMSAPDMARLMAEAAKPRPKGDGT